MMKDENLAAAMKSGMRHLASGVAVVATRDAAGMAQGMTVTSITSLTDQPASLLVCLNKASETRRALQTVEYFSANLLARDQRDVSDNFAFGPEGEARFRYGTWSDHPRYKIPCLQRALVCFVCRRDRLIDYGNHDIVVGNILEVIALDEQVPPLVYCRNGYHQLVDAD